MKSLLKILYFLFTLVILVLLAGLFLPKDGQIKSNILIKASPEIIFSQINTLKNWENWSPWYKTDSTMDLNYNGIESGEGASYTWISKESGEGTLTITKSEPLQNVETLIDFGVDGKATANLIIEEEGNQTKLTWKFEIRDMGYFERYFIILFKKNMLTTLNTGLRNIKKIAQELRLDRTSEVKVVEIANQPAMGIIDSISVEQIGSKMSETVLKLTNYLNKRGIQPTGPAFTLYYTFNPKGKIRFASCFPIPERTWGWKEYTYLELPQGQAAVITHWGKYGTSKPHDELNLYLRNINKKLAGPIWEVYMNNPAEVTDTSMWEVQIYYPFQ